MGTSLDHLDTQERRTLVRVAAGDPLAQPASLTWRDRAPTVISRPAMRAASEDGRQAILTGRILMVLAALLLLFLFVPNTPMARVAILGLVAFVATAGGLLWRAGRKA